MMIDSDLVRVCDRIAAVNIIKLSDSEEFLALTMDHLTRILCQDELGVKLEDEVLLVLQKWIKHDEESRRNDVEHFSKCIRFPLVDFDKSIGVLSEIGLVSHYQSLYNPWLHYENAVTPIVTLYGWVNDNINLTPTLGLLLFGLARTCFMIPSPRTTFSQKLGQAADSGATVDALRFVAKSLMNPTNHVRRQYRRQTKIIYTMYSLAVADETHQMICQLK